MARWLIGLFLVVHGLIHAGVWVSPKGAEPGPFDPGRSWLLGRLGLGADAARALSIALAIVATAAFVAAGAGLLADRGWWEMGALVGAVAGLVLITLFFNLWLSLGWGLEVAVLAAILGGPWLSMDIGGA